MLAVLAPPVPEPEYDKDYGKLALSNPLARRARPLAPSQPPISPPPLPQLPGSLRDPPAPLPQLLRDPPAPLPHLPVALASSDLPSDLPALARPRRLPSARPRWTPSCA